MKNILFTLLVWVVVVLVIFAFGWLLCGMTAEKTKTVTRRYQGLYYNECRMLAGTVLSSPKYYNLTDTWERNVVSIPQKSQEGDCRVGDRILDQTIEDGR